MSRGRVLHLSSVHEAGDTRIFVKECQSLVQAGFEVTLLAIGAVPPETGGVTVRTFPRRSRFARWFVTLPAIGWAAVRIRADIYHLHDPELLPLGIILRLFGRRVVYDIHEDVPRQILDKPWLARPIRPLVSWLTGLMEGAAARWLSGFVAATDSIARRFPASRRTVVHNFPRLDELEGIAATDFAKRPYEVLYIGAVSQARGAIEVVEGFRALPASLEATLVIAGPFAPPALEQRLAAASAGRPVRLLGRQTRAQVCTLLSRARVGLVTLLPTRSYLDSLPVKLFEYMASGVPVIASDFPGWRAIVESAQCGLLVDPADATAVAEAMTWLLTHPAESEAMGRRGAAAVQAQFQWATQAVRLIDFYRRLLNGATLAGE